MAADTSTTHTSTTDEIDPRLRLTLGLVRRDRRWLIAHEHHSFADTSGAG